MAKGVSKSEKQVATAAPTGVNHASAPLLMGAVVKNKAAARGLSPQQVAEYLHMEKRSVYRFFKRKYLSVPEMMDCSVMLQENLFNEYHPDLPPPPDPLQQEITRLRSYLADDEQTYKGRYETAARNLLKMQARAEAMEDMIVRLK